MNVWRLIFEELRHRWLNAALAVLAVIVAVGVVTAVQVKLEQNRALVVQRGAELEDEMRKITKGLGFNIFVYPNEPTPSELMTQGADTATMPEEYVHRLAETRLMTINHLLPVLEQRFRWPELDRYVWLHGTRSEVPIEWRHPTKPILPPVKPGTVQLGHAIAEELGVEPGETVTLAGETYEVAHVYPMRREKDDQTVYLHLTAAQALLDQPGRINAIKALNCNCESLEMLQEVRAEVQSILPDTRVKMDYDAATARAMARNQAKDSAEAALADARATAAVLWPLVLTATGVWIGLLAFGNVRDRRYEIGVLRAMGFRGRQVMLVFLGKAATLAAVGGALGIGLGVTAGWLFARFGDGQGPLVSDPAWLSAELLMILMATILGCVLVSWWPATVAARQDPALVLAEE